MTHSPTINRFAAVAAGVFLAMSSLAQIDSFRPEEAQIFVSPAGDDANDGSHERPFRTLSRARDEVRQLRAGGHGGDVIVMLRGGLYPVTETVVFGLEDSAPSGVATRYVAYPGETPVVSGAVPVDAWSRLSTWPERLPKRARGRVWVADVTEVLKRKVPQLPARTTASTGTEPVELLRNGDFADEHDGWELYAADSAQDQLDVSFEPLRTGKVACLNVRRGREAHRLQFRQSVSVVKGGEYVWRFTISADAPTSVPVMLLQKNPPHSVVIRATVDASPDPRGVTLRGVAPENLDCVASFQLGANAGRTIRVADVSLEGPEGMNPYANRPVHDTAGRFFTLFEGDDRLPRARGPGFRQINRGGSWHEGAHDQLQFPQGALRSGDDIVDAEVRMIPRAQWVQNLLPIQAVDEDKRVATLRYPATYAVAYCGAGHDETVWVENLIDHLDQPGEWVLDSRNAKLYLWPRGDRPVDIRVPLLTELVRIEGQIDHDGPADVPVTGIEFQGITFTQAERFSWHGLTGWGVQHDWEAYDAPSAMVRLRGAESCALVGCAFVNSGATGLRLDLHAQRNVIRGNHFAHLGGVGVFLCGYGPGAKDVNRDNTIVDNYIHHVGETYWASPGIFLWQSGHNRVAHNTLHDTPYTAIVVSCRAGLASRPGTGEGSATIRNHEIQPRQRGGWEQREPLLHGRMNTVEFNDIFRVMQTLGDGNGIYVSGTGRENRVQHNYVHDTPSQHMAEGIRCDDDQHDTIIHGNVVWGLGGHATGITIKGRNTITNNIIGAPCVPRTARGFISLELGSMEGTVIRRNVLYATSPGHAFVFQRRLYGNGPSPRMRDADADFNLYWCTEKPARAEAFLAQERKHGIETHSRVADPLFKRPDSGDFRFADGSPAVEMGIDPVDVSTCGIRQPFRDRYIKPAMETSITPAGGVLRRPVRVALTSSRKDAVIHYTYNGALPTRRSARYDGPLTITEPGLLRARSFLDGYADAGGASARFSPPPRPLRMDLTPLDIGDKAPLAVTHEEEGSEATIRVAADTSGVRFLQFRDEPGQKHDFNPHLSIPYAVTSGRLIGRLTVRVDAATHMYYQWRHHASRPIKNGPTFHIRPGGRLGLAGGRELMQLPLDTWVSLEVVGSVGGVGSGTFDLHVRVPGTQKARTFTALGVAGGEFDAMDSLFLVAQGVEKATFGVRDIELIPAD